jgi:hypothetical protein
LKQEWNSGQEGIGVAIVSSQPEVETWSVKLLSDIIVLIVIQGPIRLIAINDVKSKAQPVQRLDRRIVQLFPAI